MNLEDKEACFSPKQEEYDVQESRISKEILDKEKEKKKEENTMEDITNDLIEVNSGDFQQENRVKGNKISNLDEQHIQELKNSGILDETTYDYKQQGLLRSIKAVEKAADLRISSKAKGSALLFNYPDCDYHICKLDNPRKNDKGKEIKYECPVDEQPRIYKPLGFDIKAPVKILTEGAKKAIKAQQEGYNTVSFGGVWSYKSKKNDDGINSYFKEFVEELIAVRTKVIYLCFDNDITEKESVKLAFKHLTFYMLSRGIETREIKLPYHNGQKLGLDDYLMLEDADLDKLITEAKISNETLLEYALHGRSLKVGKTFAVENATIDSSLQELYKSIPVGYYTLKKETYFFDFKLKRKGFEMGILIKKANFAMELTFNTITITQAVRLIELFNREIRISAPKQSPRQVITDISEINTVEKFDNLLKSLGHYVHAFKDAEIRDYINHVFESHKVPDLYISNNTGFNIIAGGEVWLAENKVINYKGNKGRNLPQIRLADKLRGSANKIFDLNLLTADKAFEEYVKEAQIYFEINSKLTVQETVCLSFVYNLHKTYNGALEPFMIIGLAFMSPFATHIFKEFKSFPLGYLEGQTATGKSNLLNLIAYLFGFDSTYPKSGNDTPKNILFHLQQNVSIPILLNEVGDALRPRLNEWVIKPVFDRTARRVMKRSGEEERATAINSTMVFNTNAPINKEPAIVNRLLHTYWEKGIFNVDEAKRFNSFVSYLSILIPHVVESTDIQELMEKIQTWNNSDILKCIWDTRHKINLAIALTGLEIFLSFVNQLQSTNLKMFEGKIESYVLNYEKKAVDNEFEKAINATRVALIGKGTSLKASTDYKEVSCRNRYGLHIHTGKGGESFKAQVVNAYANLYRDSRPIRFADYENLLTENGIEKEKATYGKQSKYGLFFPYNEFEEIELWFKDYNEGLFSISGSTEATENIEKIGTDVF